MLQDTQVTAGVDLMAVAYLVGKQLLQGGAARVSSGHKIKWIFNARCRLKRLKGKAQFKHRHNNKPS